MQALQSTWTSVKNTFQTWVVDHLVADYIQLPDNVTWSNVLKAVWTSVSGGFKSWVVDHLIADYVKMPDDATWSSAIKGVWETVQAGFKSWVVDHLVADYIQLPDNVTWSNVLKAVWTSVSGGFKSWVVDHLIADYVKMPDDVTWSSALKGVWETVRTSFTNWLTTAGQRISDYFELPNVQGFLAALQVIWSMVGSQFGAWLTSAGERISDFFAAPTVDGLYDLLKAAWLVVSRRFVAFLIGDAIYGQIRNFFGVPDEASFVESLKIIWKSIRSTVLAWLGLPDNELAAGITVDTSSLTTISKFLTDNLSDFRAYVNLLWYGPSGKPSTGDSTKSAAEETGALAEAMGDLNAELEAGSQESKHGLRDLLREYAIFARELSEVLVPPFLEKLGQFVGWIVELSGLESPDILGLIDEFTNAIEHTRDLLAETELQNPFKAFGDWFVENPIGPLMDTWAAAIGVQLSEWSAGFIESFRTLWSLISGIWTGGGDEINTTTSVKFTAVTTFLDTSFATLTTNVQGLWDSITGIWQGAWDELNTIAETAWGALTTFLTGSFAMLDNAFAIAMIWINQGWAAGWESIKATVSDAWSEIQATMENLFGGFGEWVQARVSDLGNGIVAIANSIIGVINSIVTAINKPIRAWNDLTFSVGRIGRSFTYPTGVSLEGVTTASRWFGFPRVHCQDYRPAYAVDFVADRLWQRRRRPTGCQHCDARIGRAGAGADDGDDRGAGAGSGAAHGPAARLRRRGPGRRRRSQAGQHLRRHLRLG